MVDDDQDDSVLVTALLSEAFGAGLRPEWVDTFEGGYAAMVEGRHDVCLVDYRLGGRDGLDLIREATQAGCRAPIIFLTGQNCRQTDMDAMAAGAVDYLLKDEISASLLERSIRYAIERKRVEQRLEQIGFEDGLTGLWNRTLFHNRLEHAIELARREGGTFTVAILDLDRFKAVNDRFGHAAGDAVLVEFARRARSILRASDTLARIGGDEFAALLPTASSPEGAAVVARRLVGVCDRPIALKASAESREVQIGLSVGIALFPLDGADPSAVLSSADHAMYRAKRGGGGHAFAREGDRAKPLDVAMLVGPTQAADAEDQIEIRRRPELDLGTGSIRGLEAWACWHHPEQGLVSQPALIRAADATAAIEPLTIAILEKALTQAAELRDAGHDLPLTVTLSAACFRHEGLPDAIGDLLAASGVAPDRLTFSVSEDGLARDPDRAVTVLRKVADCGVALAIDDFAGSVGLVSRLKDLPIAEIRISGSLVETIADDAADRAVVRSILGLCRDLGIRSLAKSVDRPSMLRVLAELGCDRAQGRHISEPLSADRIVPWIGSWPVRPVAGAKEGR